MRSIPSSALASSAPATILVESVSHEDSAISHPRDQDYLSSQERMVKLGGAAACTKHIWWLTYAKESEKRNNTTVAKLEMIKK